MLTLIIRVSPTGAPFPESKATKKEWNLHETMPKKLQQFDIPKKHAEYGFIYLLFKNDQILYFLLQQGFHIFYIQVVIGLCLYVHYYIKLIFFNSKIFMLLFLIFIFVVSNIICVHYKNVIIRQLIRQKIIMLIFLTNEIPLVKFPQVFNY